MNDSSSLKSIRFQLNRVVRHLKNDGGVLIGNGRYESVRDSRILTGAKAPFTALPMTPEKVWLALNSPADQSEQKTGFDRNHG
jgi:hypothetical protein